MRAAAILLMLVMLGCTNIHISGEGNRVDTSVMSEPTIVKTLDQPIVRLHKVR